MQRRLVCLGFLGVSLFTGMLVASEAKVLSDSKKIDDACYYLDEVRNRAAIVAWDVRGDTVFAGCSDGEIMIVRDGEVRTLVKRNDHSQDKYAGFGGSEAELLAITVLRNDALVVVLNTGLIEIFYSIKPGRLQLIWSNEEDVSKERGVLQDKFDNWRLAGKYFLNLAHACEAGIGEINEGVGVLLGYDTGHSIEKMIPAEKIKEAILSKVRSCYRYNASKKRIKRLFFQ